MGGGKEIPDIVGTYQGVLGEELDHKNEVSLKIVFWVLWLLQTGGKRGSICYSLKCLRWFRQGFSGTSLPLVLGLLKVQLY